MYFNMVWNILWVGGMKLFFFIFCQVYLYEKDTKTVSYSDFVNKELVLFSNADNERSIPCLVDGK